jgi:hypothetical protein
MRILISFCLAFISYILILFFFFLIFNFNNTFKRKEVLIHTAIISKNIVTNHNSKKAKLITHNKDSAVSTIKHIVRKRGSKNAFTKGGNDIKFDDIFKRVDYNIDTKKLVLKKQLDMSRFKGIEKNLRKVKFINMNVSYINKTGNISDKDINDIIVKKLSPIWNSISDVIGEYAKLNIISDKGLVKVVIINTNLSETKQNLLVNEIKKLRFNKSFNIIVKFITKANK